MTLGAMPCCRRLNDKLATCVLYHPGQMGKKVAVGEILPLVLRFPTISITPPILHTHLIVIDTKEPHQLTALLTPTKRVKFYYQLIHKRNALRGVSKLTLKQLQHVSV
jgi:hypothetical protein